jgi:hypothetical protein
MPFNQPVPLPVSRSPADICLRDPLTVDDIASPWTWPPADDYDALGSDADLWAAIVGGAI